LGIRLLVADDHQIARAGVVSMITGTEIEVACQAVNCSQAVRYALTCDPDVVLLDISLPDGNGFSALDQIKKERPEMSVLIFSACENLSELKQARQKGADGYVSKATRREDFLRTIRRAAGGKKAWTKEQVRRMKQGMGPAPDLRIDSTLTPREQEVLQKAAQGLGNEEIAEELAIDMETVKQHIKHILKKLGLVDRTQAALWALRKGLI
jgi:DNA-binding NarL/FixJ family response regulator